MKPAHAQAINSLKRETPTPTGAVPPPSREALIDEYGELDRKLKLMEPTRKRHEELKAQIKAWYEQFPPERACEEQGKLYTLIISPREMEAKPDWKALLKDHGTKLVLRFCSITQKAVKELLAENQRPEAESEQYFTKTRTGSRKLTVVAKSSPAA